MKLLGDANLEQVIADPAEAEYLLAKARTHLSTASRNAADDPEIAYDALYAAARKALTAVLVQQGLRPTRAGGHEAVIQAAEAQLAPELGAVLRPYRRLRRMRRGGDYLASDAAISIEDVTSDLPVAADIVEAAARVVPNMPVFIPRR
jgi:HEPN domain